MSSKRWWRSHAVTSPGALAAKLSRRARHHGAIFAIPAKDKFVPVGYVFIQSRQDEFGARRKGLLSRCNYLVMRRKNCDKLINYTRLLAFVLVLKLSLCNEFVTIFEICQGFGSWINWRICLVMAFYFFI
jgi:hypothetical protein